MAYLALPRIHTDLPTLVMLFAETAFDEIFATQHQWFLVLDYEYISEIDRNITIGIVGRLGVMMDVCHELARMADVLNKECRNAVVSAEVAEVCELAARYLPGEE
jgi:hypothetical protein